MTKLNRNDVRSQTIAVACSAGTAMLCAPVTQARHHNNAPIPDIISHAGHGSTDCDSHAHLHVTTRTRGGPRCASPHHIPDGAAAVGGAALAHHD